VVLHLEHDGIGHGMGFPADLTPITAETLAGGQVLEARRVVQPQNGGQWSVFSCLLGGGECFAVSFGSDTDRERSSEALSAGNMSGKLWMFAVWGKQPG
jgi:hypothetical protein